VASVQIVGDWQGAVRLDIDYELARRACANLTGVEADTLSAQDVRDAAGELANMLGGSVKALCAHNSRLSLPTVAIGRNFEFSLCQGTVVQVQSFGHGSGKMTVSVIEKQDRPHSTHC
jgi:chemotaxis protein CheX